ncbi:activator-dependent family glycosyltransferase [Dactylosporangium sp. NBC_01737]|uniref:activator-dependent family glycosyltransferase n=1 Tax=Dactylosporangium sp. NBC_01737 TaxID=2975959 RepID=UPI002E0FF0A6|nr:activator-dependent family glycosyltransferase [Dactylosporangium sp. NBC_01737]
MRVLFVTNPEKSIFQYMVPLAWALRTAGHEVCFAGQPGFAPLITQAGLTAVPVGQTRDNWRVAKVAHNAHHAVRAGIPAPYDAFDDPAKQTWDYLLPGMRTAATGWHRMSNFPIISELVDFARSWRPDLVIWEPLTYAGAIAAKACGAAHARLLFGIDVFGGVRRIYRRVQQTPEDPLMEWFGGYARRYGFAATEDLAVGHFTIDQFPASLQVEAPGIDYVRTQFIGYGGPASVPGWLREPPARPRVAFTMGLSATEVYDGYTLDLQDVLDSVADLDIELVATVAQDEQRKLARVPANARLVPFVPWHALAPTCSVVVHHAGAATLATTARHPVPQLALHYHYDQPTIGRLLARHGAGLAMHTSQATGASVRDAIVRLLREPAFRDRAADLRAEILAAPSPNQLVPRLEELTVTHQTA